MEKVLIESSDWVHFEGSLYNSSGRLKCRVIGRRGLEKGFSMRTELASQEIGGIYISPAIIPQSIEVLKVSEFKGFPQIPH